MFFDQKNHQKPEEKQRFCRQQTYKKPSKKQKIEVRKQWKNQGQTHVARHFPRASFPFF